ncbi:MAG TPA: SigE family RNA polymerase sigma factor [Trebonia sp.]|nr:SigE family RNA polymerase sigma factor [Trebonia sp.]
MGAAPDEEFDSFMRGRWPAMVRLAYALTGDLGHAEDVAQAAFARAYASWGRVRRAGDPDAYVRRIVVNANRSRFRRPRVPEELRGDLTEILSSQRSGGQWREPEDAQALEDREALLAALCSLGPRQRAVIVLRYWLDLSEAQTAAALNCSVGTVKSQASRALATLRKTAGPGDGAPTADSRADSADSADSGDSADIVEGGWR